MLQLTNVMKRYGERKALDGINLHIGKGVCYGLIGPNGAGKSTLMKIIVSIIEDFQGEVLIFNYPLRKTRKDIKKRIGYVPQDIVLEEKLTSLDNLIFFGRLYGLSGKKLMEQIELSLKKVGLYDRRKDAVASFSGGMKRRLNIAAALLHEPDVIILDEPTVGVDPQSRNHIFQIINDLKRSGKTILYSSHYMEEVESLCDEIALIDQGMIVESGTIRELLQKYAIKAVFVQGSGIGISDLSLFGNTSMEKDGFRIETENPLQTIHQLAELLHKKQVNVESLEITQPSLEDIFLSLTGSTLRD